MTMTSNYDCSFSNPRKISFGNAVRGYLSTGTGNNHIHASEEITENYIISQHVSILNQKNCRIYYLLTHKYSTLDQHFLYPGFQSHPVQLFGAT